jgi:hypothetical protein
MFRLIVFAGVLLSLAGCSAKIEVLTDNKKISNMLVSDAETGFFIAFAPCTLEVKRNSSIIVRYDVVSSNYCINHKECEDCVQFSNSAAYASQLFDVDGDGTFYVGK